MATVKWHRAKCPALAICTEPEVNQGLCELFEVGVDRQNWVNAIRDLQTVVFSRLQKLISNKLNSLRIINIF
jgi:hypothetical protein